MSRRRGWVARTAELRGELEAIADAHPRWWLLAGGVAAAEPWGETGEYVRSDAEPGEDTFLGIVTPRPVDPLGDAVAHALAARTALRELDGTLPEQPLAVTIQRDATRDDGLASSTLGVAAFAVGERCLVAELDSPTLAADLAAFARGEPGPSPATWAGAAPFVCVSIGDDPPSTARHGHRRAWVDERGPWLGIGRSGSLSTVSTCHRVVDGYGHARITGRIAELAVVSATPSGFDPPPLAPVAGAIPLGVAWRTLGTTRAPHALRLAYALGRVLHRAAGRRSARFSPTFQIPIAPGDRNDPQRIRRRGIPGIVSVRFDGGAPEAFADFEARARDVLAREAEGRGLCSRLINAARGAPAPLAWKRKGISATRPQWLDRISDVIGGRACLSKIRVDATLPPAVAVSSPARLATPSDPFGGCVVTLVDAGPGNTAITACGSGRLAGDHAGASALLDELLAIV